MPRYNYRCCECDKVIEVVKPLHDETSPKHCGCTMVKVFAVFGVVFKGSGFYKNDKGK